MSRRHSRISSCSFSGMNIFGKPVVGQFGSDLRLPRLRQHRGARGGELQPRADVVGEAGDFRVLAPSRRLAVEQVAEVGVAVRGILPPTLVALLPHVGRAGQYIADLLRLLAVVQEDAVAAAEHLAVDLLQLDAADVHPGPQPFRLDHSHHGGGCGEDYVGAFDANLNVVCGLYILMLRTECSATFRPGAEHAHFPETPDCARRHELRAGLPAGADEGERRDVLARQVLEREPARRADAQALHHAVREHREQRAGLGAEKEHQADPAALAVRSRGERLLHAPRLAGDERVRHDVGVDAQRLDLARRPGAAHVLEAVVAVGTRRWRDVVHARREQGLAIRVVPVHRLERGHAVLDAEEPRDLVVRQDEHWSWRSRAWTRAVIAWFTGAAAPTSRPTRGIEPLITSISLFRPAIRSSSTEGRAPGILEANSRV